MVSALNLFPELDHDLTRISVDDFLEALIEETKLPLEPVKRKC